MPPIKGSSRQANRACSGWLNWAIHSTTSTGSCHSAILGSPAYDSVRQKPLSWQESLCARSQPGREIANVGFFRKCSQRVIAAGCAVHSPYDHEYLAWPQATVFVLGLHLHRQGTHHQRSLLAVTDGKLLPAGRRLPCRPGVGPLEAAGPAADLADERVAGYIEHILLAPRT